MYSPVFRALYVPLVDTLKTVFRRTDAQGDATLVAVLRDADLRPALMACARRRCCCTTNWIRFRGNEDVAVRSLGAQESFFRPPGQAQTRR
jgi:hypothetical protein